MPEMQTPWDRARKTRSQRQENRLANSEGGQAQNNSGRFWRWKRDGKLFQFLVECRTTEKESYRIEAKEWKAIERHANQTPGSVAAMQIDIGDDVKLVVLNERNFRELQQYIAALESDDALHT